jgi:rare lipoprotein A
MAVFFLAGCGTLMGPKQTEQAMQVVSTEVGIASYYGPQWHGRTTANGEKMDIHAMTAAHKSLPFGTWVRVVLLSTGNSVVVRINDRGPYVAGRIIDLADDAARELGLMDQGIGKVRVEVLK